MLSKPMKLALIFTAAPLAAMAAPAQAQSEAQPQGEAQATATAQPTEGTAVYDAAGNQVGTIRSVAAPNFVIDTGKNTATLALSSLGQGPKGPVIGFTRDELDAAVEKAAADAAAALAAAIVVDAPVHASDGVTVIGRISEVAEADFVLDTGTTKVKLPRTAVANGANGLFIGMTAQQFVDATRSAATGQM